MRVLGCLPARRERHHAAGRSSCRQLRLAANERDEVLQLRLGHVREGRHPVTALHGLLTDSRVGQVLNRAFTKLGTNATAQISSVTRNAPQRRELLEILEDRHERRSTLVTSQLPVEHWHKMIGEPTHADAILDRLVHNAYRIVLKGESMRKMKAKGGGSLTA